jgi:hypothetical protein
MVQVCRSPLESHSTGRTVETPKDHLSGVLVVSQFSCQPLVKSPSGVLGGCPGKEYLPVFAVVFPMVSLELLLLRGSEMRGLPTVRTSATVTFSLFPPAVSDVALAGFVIGGFVARLTTLAELSRCPVSQPKLGCGLDYLASAAWFHP